MKATAFLASVLTLMVVSQLKAEAGPSPSTIASEPSKPVSPAILDGEVQKYVVSPWGHGAFYLVVPGINYLQCSVTGETFTYFVP